MCPATGCAKGPATESLDTSTVQVFLDQLSAATPSGVHMVLVWDGAGYHFLAEGASGAGDPAEDM